MAKPNSYSSYWFEFFHAPIGEERTAREIGFICSVAPWPEFRRVIDVCCGIGRHARALAARGYSVAGIERDASAIGKARELGGGPDYVQADVREYLPARCSFDLAVVMSQSFGYFDSETNRNVLGRLAGGIRKGGRIILDLWNADFFTVHQGERTLETPWGTVLETKRIEDGRLLVHLTYPDGADEDFDWQLFTPAEMESLAGSVGLMVRNTCTNLSLTTEPDVIDPRIQFVLSS